MALHNYHAGNAAVLRLALLCLLSIVAAGVLAKSQAVKLLANSSYDAVSVAAFNILSESSVKNNLNTPALSTLEAVKPLAASFAKKPPVSAQVNAALFTKEFSADIHVQVPVSIASENINTTLWFHSDHPEHFYELSRELAEHYSHVGFPHIETNERDSADQYKPYKALLSSHSGERSGLVARVQCMGLTPMQVSKRAEPYDSLILDLAIKHRISASLIKAVVSKESCFNQSARSPVGAAGLMQLMPETAQWLNVSNVDDPEENLAGGVRYLAGLKKRFKSTELALAAYNAGPGNVERYNGIPPFAETEQYVKDVMHFYRGYTTATRVANMQGIVAN